MWIKCSDRLPTEGEFVLCAVDNKDIWVGCRVEYFSDEIVWHDRSDNCCIGPVTHWMPLPKLPKEE